MGESAARVFSPVGTSTTPEGTMSAGKHTVPHIPAGPGLQGKMLVPTKGEVGEVKGDKLTSLIHNLGFEGVTAPRGGSGNLWEYFWWPQLGRCPWPLVGGGRDGVKQPPGRDYPTPVPIISKPTFQ